MALPIGDTPILEGKDAERFAELINNGLKRPATLVPTPKVEEGRKLVKAYANGRKK